MPQEAFHCELKKLELCRSDASPFWEDNFPIPTYFASAFLMLSYSVWRMCCLFSLVLDNLNWFRIVRITQRLMEQLRRTTSWDNRAGGQAVQLPHFHPLSWNSTPEKLCFTTRFECVVGGFYSFTAATRIFFSPAPIKWKWSQVRGQVYECLRKAALCVLVSSSSVSCCVLRSFQGFAWQLRTAVCFLYLIKKTIPCQLVYILYPGEYMYSPLLSLTTDDLFMAAAWLKAEESRRVCGFVDICHSLPLLYSISGN